MAPSKLSILVPIKPPKTTIKNAMKYSSFIIPIPIASNAIIVDPKNADNSPRTDIAPSIPGSTCLKVVIRYGLTLAVLPISLARVSPIAVATDPRNANRHKSLYCGKSPHKTAKISATKLLLNTFL